MTSRKTETRRLEELKEHPRQREFFSDATKPELNELAADMDQRGQREPVHILPDNTVVLGCQRVRAARQLGWNEIDVVVRHDLAEAGENAILYELVSDNVIRRQVDDLSLARCYKELRAIENREFLDGRRKGRMGDSRDRLAARLGGRISGRQLDRLARLLDLPRPIQDAIARREMPQSLGHKILGLKIGNREKIAQCLEQGDGIEQIIEQFKLKQNPQRAPKLPADIGKEFFAFLNTHLGVLYKHVEQLDQGSYPSIPVLERTAKLLAELLNRKRSRRKKTNA